MPRFVSLLPLLLFCGFSDAKVLYSIGNATDHGYSAVARIIKFEAELYPERQILDYRFLATTTKSINLTTEIEIYTYGDLVFHTKFSDCNVAREGKKCPSSIGNLVGKA